MAVSKFVVRERARRDTVTELLRSLEQDMRADVRPLSYLDSTVSRTVEKWADRLVAYIAELSKRECSP